MRTALIAATLALALLTLPPPFVALFAAGISERNRWLEPQETK